MLNKAQQERFQFTTLCFGVCGGVCRLQIQPHLTILVGYLVSNTFLQLTDKLGWRATRVSSKDRFSPGTLPFSKLPFGEVQPRFWTLGPTLCSFDCPHKSNSSQVQLFPIVKGWHPEGSIPKAQLLSMFYAACTYHEMALQQKPFY